MTNLLLFIISFGGVCWLSFRAGCMGMLEILHKEAPDLYDEWKRRRKERMGTK